MFGSFVGYVPNGFTFWSRISLLQKTLNPRRFGESKVVYPYPESWAEVLVRDHFHLFSGNMEAMHRQQLTKRYTKLFAFSNLLWFINWMEPKHKDFSYIVQKKSQTTTLQNVAVFRKVRWRQFKLNCSTFELKTYECLNCIHLLIYLNTKIVFQTDALSSHSYWLISG